MTKQVRSGEFGVLMLVTNPRSVIPAEAGIHIFSWIHVCTGMTEWRAFL